MEEMQPVHPLNADGVTPEVVLQHVAADMKDITSLFVVAFKGGIPFMYASGSLSELSLSSFVLQNACLQTMNSQGEPE